MTEENLSQIMITLDMREDFRAGLHPCDRIQNALKQVGPGQTLRLVVPFEPVPLFEVARNKGLTHKAGQIPGGDWEVLFFHGAQTDAPNTQRAVGSAPGCDCGCRGTAPTEVVEVDARHLEPPQPMVKVLEALSALPEGGRLCARTDRRPIHLYPVLEARGFTAESEEQPDGSYITQIRRH